jgi:predicted nuclease with TOPRIM domain
MARGVRKPLDERIQTIQDEIQGLEERKTGIDTKIAALKEKLEPLVNEQKLNELEDVKKVMESTGLSPDQIIKKLSDESA